MFKFNMRLGTVGVCVPLGVIFASLIEAGTDKYPRLK